MARVKGPEPDSPAEARLAYASCTTRGHEATRRGQFREALEAYCEAQRIAQEHLGSYEQDASALNVAMVRIQLGQARESEEGLREILLRSQDPQIAFAAAYNLAGSLRRQGRYDRAWVYARRAMAWARESRHPDARAQCHNLLGNILVNQNKLDEALREYRRALTIRRRQKADTRYSESILWDNLGYALLLRGRVRRGLTAIRRALALAVEVGYRRCEAECHQDLCYGLLIAGDHAAARRHGETALAQAQEHGYEDIEENCHYLLGELGARTGDLEYRDHHFGQLQHRHPELPFLKDFLCAVDVTRIITLKR